MAFTMHCNLAKFQPHQIEFLTENHEGIKKLYAGVTPKELQVHYKH